MECIYTIDPNAAEPIMLIDDEIGLRDDGKDGIMGDKFSRELLFLDTLNKSKINIWINSPGGSVTDGQQIYNTILKTKTKVDTHCVGMAASIAFPILLAGRNRYMMDNTVAMMHPVAGGDHKSRQAFEDAVNTMLSSRSFIPADKITEMMNRTTWLSAEDCGPNGLNVCEVEKSGEYNKPRKTADVKALHFDFKSIVNKLIQDKTIKMADKVTNKLSLVDGASDDQKVLAIEKIENRATLAESKLTAQETENKTKLDAINSQLEVEKTARAASDKKLKELEDKAAADLLVSNKARAVDFVKTHVASGRIANEVDVINHWTEQLTSDFDKNKVVVEKLPINKKGPGAPGVPPGEQRTLPPEADVPSIDVNNTGSYVARMNAKTYNKAKERFK